jgi:hypothetical protein
MMARRFAWQGTPVPAPRCAGELIGSVTHVSDDVRYRWLNEVREIVWEPLETNG